MFSFECLTNDGDTTIDSSKYIFKYNVFVCGPDLGDEDGCEPETECQLCGPDYGTDCMPECGPEEGY